MLSLKSKAAGSIVAIALLVSGCAIEHHQTAAQRNPHKPKNPQRTTTGAKTVPLADAPRPTPVVTGTTPSLQEWCEQRYVNRHGWEAADSTNARKEGAGRPDLQTVHYR